MRRWNFPADGLLLESDLSGILLFHNGNPTPRLSIFLKKEPSNLWWQHMPSNSKRLGQYSSTCRRLLNRLLSVWLLSSAFYSTYCPWAQGFLFYFRINLQIHCSVGWVMVGGSQTRTLWNSEPRPIFWSKNNGNHHINCDICLCEWSTYLLWLFFLTFNPHNDPRKKALYCPHFTDMKAEESGD